MTCCKRKHFLLFVLSQVDDTGKNRKTKRGNDSSMEMNDKRTSLTGDGPPQQNGHEETTPAYNDEDVLHSQPSPAVTPITGASAEPSKKTKCRNLFRHRIEPLLFCIMLAIAFSIITSQNLLINKICRVHFKYPDEVCKNYTGDPKIGDKIQSRVANYLMIATYIETIPGLLLSFFLGTWSDRHGRKLPIIAVSIGGLLSSLSQLVNAYFVDLRPEYLFIGNIFIGLSGGLAALLMAVFSYVADVSSRETRTRAIALADLSLAGALAVGIVASSAIYEVAGFLPIYFCNIIFCIVGCLYTIFVLEESVPTYQAPAGKRRNLCKEVFDVHNVKQSFLTVLRYREGNRRTHILLLILSLCVLMIPFIGENSVLLLYTSRQFGWTQTELSYYKAVEIIINVIGLIILFKFVIKKFKLHDLVSGLIGVSGNIIKGLIIGLASASWMMYAASLLSFFQPISMPVVRSLLSKMVDTDEQGRVFALLASCEAAVPLFASTLYTQTYKATLSVFPGTPFLISAGLVVIPVCTFSFILYQMKTTDSIQEVESNDTNGSHDVSIALSPQTEEKYSTTSSA